MRDRRAALKRDRRDVDDARVFLVAALRARRTSVIGVAMFVCVLCSWLAVAAPANATVTSLAVGNLSLAENSPFSGTVATFVTDDPFDTFSFSVDWGDGTMNSGPATVTGDAGSVSASHAYAEDGTYTLTVTIIESGGSPGTRSASATVTVGEADASLVAVAPIATSEGTTFAGPVAYLTDAGSPDPASSFTASIDWGDGTTTPGTVSGAGGSFTISGSHRYTDELHSGAVKLTVSEVGGGSALGSVQDTINVLEADTLTAHPLSITASDGVPFTGSVATFSDSTAVLPGDFAVTIGWGDGTSSSGVLTSSGATLIVSGNHTYHSAPGNYTVTVQLVDDAPGTATASATATAAVRAGKPSVVTLGATNVTASKAMLAATVDPDGGATTYAFQYGTTSAYGSTTKGVSAGAGNGDQGVSALLSSLAPGTTYHYRVVATNAAGSTVGADHTFTTIALIAAVKARRGGSFTVVVSAPGPGAVRLVVIAGNTKFGFALVRTKHAGRLKVVVHPTRAARRLLSRRHQHIKLLLRVVFTPRKGRSVSSTLRGLRPIR